MNDGLSSENGIGDEGAKELGDGLRCNIGLMKVKLGCM